MCLTLLTVTETSFIFEQRSYFTLPALGRKDTSSEYYRSISPSTNTFLLDFEILEQIGWIGVTVADNLSMWEIMSS